MSTTHKLRISHGTSKARDTYGYPTVTLTDDTGRKFKCMGGGYDMFGTVLAQWISRTFPERVAELASSSYYILGRATGTVVDEQGYYGVYHNVATGRTWLDGAVGESTIQRLARDRMGLTIRNTVNRQGHTTGYVVEDNR